MKTRDQMKMHELYAQWWLHSASNGHSARRIVHQGGASPEYQGKQLTPEELIDDAMRISNTHIQAFINLADKVWIEDAQGI